MNEEDKAKLKMDLARRWLDPVQRCEDIFRVRMSKGGVVDVILPEPHREILREGILGKAKPLIDDGLRFTTVTDKGRQIGFSTLFAMEAMLIAEDYPNTNIFYIADDMDQTGDFLDKITQLGTDAKHYPPELGGGPILNCQNLEKTFEKKINNSYIVGLSGRAKGGKRGKNAIAVYWDEAAWCISRHQEQEEIWDTILHFVKQGGQIRIGSTPRTTDDKFWTFYSNAPEWGMKAYYRPTITNWKDLDLKSPLFIDLNNDRRLSRQLPAYSEDDKREIVDRYKGNERYIVDLEGQKIYQKNIQIPYPWIKLDELELERNDYEKFLQENLGISVDEKYKLIPSEWIYRNIARTESRDNRSQSTNPIYILIDLARVNDVTAITVTEKFPDNFCIERKVEETQEHYDLQVERIWTLYERFKAQAISIDNTGHGIVIGDLLEAKLRENGLPLNILHRVNFTSTEKEIMAEGFRSLVQMDKYKFLNENKVHKEALRHVERVEKEVLPTNTRYSGKKWGRDDHFWSKAQIVYFTNMLIPMPEASFGKFRKEPYTTPAINEVVQRVSTEKIHEEEVPVDLKHIAKIKAIGKVLHELDLGSVDCPKTGEMEKPVLCTGCDRTDCIYYDSMEKVCKVVGVTPLDVWAKQKVFPQDKHGGVVNEETFNDAS